MRIIPDLNTITMILATISCLTFGHVPASNAQSACEAIFTPNDARPTGNSGKYGPQDFPPSTFWLGSNDQNFYSSTAAVAANKIAASISAEGNVRDAFATAVAWRAQKAFLTDSYDRPVERDWQYCTPLGRQYQEFGRQLAQTYNDGDLKTFYRTLSGARVESSLLRIFKSKALPHADGATAFHPRDPFPILQDGLNRLEGLLSAPRPSKAAAERIFVEAMYAYYIAVPKNRGSAAIGKVFFAGVFKGYFGRPLPRLPDGVDLEAIIRSEESRREEFIEKFVGLLQQR